jgi:peptide/nickel transport system permease protein
MSAYAITDVTSAATTDQGVVYTGGLAPLWKRFRKHRAGVIGLVILSIILAATLLMPLLSPFDQNTVNPASAFAPAGSVDTLNGHVHWLGTDYLGRDTFTRLFNAGRTSLLVALVATLAILVVGLLVGSAAGYLGGWSDTLLMRLTDFMLALPLLPMYIFAIKLVRSTPSLSQFADDHEMLWTLGSMAGVFVLFGWMGLARLVRGSILSLRTRDYIEAARALGADGRRIVFRHLVPNAAGPVLVAATFAAGDFIILEAVLSYFGLGVYEYSAPSWGNMLAGVQNYVWYTANLNPFQEIRGYLIFLPTLMILGSVLSLNYIGDALRDAIDPQ